MKLLTKELENKFKKYPLGSQDGTGNYRDEKIIAKFFLPVGAATWYATEGEKEGDDFTFFGYVDLGLGPGCAELGYFSLKELENLTGPFGCKVERDMYFGYDHTLNDVIPAEEVA